jgi:hypothetical protein
MLPGKLCERFPTIQERGNKTRDCAATFALIVAVLAFSFELSAQTTQLPAVSQKQAVNSSKPANDLRGVWNLHELPSQRKFINTTYTQEGPTMTPWAKEKYEADKPSNGRGPRAHTLDQTDDPVLKSCLPPGVPRIYLQPLPMQIVETQNEVIILYEYDHTVRHIYTDGRPHPADLTPSYMGDSIGHWDGNTFVVDTIGLNDKTWLDRDGHVHSDQLHVLERFQRVDHDNLQLDIAMEDPKALEEPWKATLVYQLKPDWNIIEQDCADNADFLGFEK